MLCYWYFVDARPAKCLLPGWKEGRSRKRTPFMPHSDPCGEMPETLKSTFTRRRSQWEIDFSLRGRRAIAHGRICEWSTNRSIVPNRMSVFTFLQWSSKSILSRRHVVPAVLIFNAVVHRPSSARCCGWYDWPASQSTAICGSHRGEAACKERFVDRKRKHVSQFSFVGLQISNVQSLPL